MKARLALAACLLASAPAFAQPAPPSPGPDIRACAGMLQASMQREFAATAALNAAQDQITAKDKQLADLTKERDELKAKETPVPAATGAPKP
jgi:hypothetical protein